MIRDVYVVLARRVKNLEEWDEVGRFYDRPKAEIYARMLLAHDVVVRIDHDTWEINRSGRTCIKSDPDIPIPA